MLIVMQQKKIKIDFSKSFMLLLSMSILFNQHMDNFWSGITKWIIFYIEYNTFSFPII